ncbi:type II toxin-antitoxin system HicB family antitoxin [bacterium]|nr:type II toxin-antitoxin system HicB family antitoxin [FCB group bacterium]MBL7191004.1 type II toxin-antitoxin system HicB family antitoxin [bacterium]
MIFKVVLEPSDEGGYTVYAPSLPGCISEGDDKEEALKNIREAIELYLEPVEDDFTYAPEVNGSPAFPKSGNCMQVNPINPGFGETGLL